MNSHQFGHGAPIGQEFQETVQPDGAHADPEAAPAGSRPASPRNAPSPKLVSLQFGRKVTAVSILQFVPVSDALVDLHRHGEIIAENAAQSAGGVRALGDQAGIQQQAFVLDPQAPAQAFGAHADQVEQRVGEWIRLLIPGGAQFIEDRRPVLFPGAIEQ